MTVDMIALEVGILVGLLSIGGAMWKIWTTVKESIVRRTEYELKLISRMDGQDSELAAIRRDINGDGLGGKLDRLTVKVDSIEDSLNLGLRERDEIMRNAAVKEAAFTDAIQAALPSFRPPHVPDVPLRDT